MEVMFSGLSREEFLLAIREVIREEMQFTSTSGVEDEFLSVKELQKLFKPSVSRVTVNNWCSHGLLNKLFIGGRVYFRKSEVLESLTTIRKYKHHIAA